MAVIAANCPNLTGRSTWEYSSHIKLREAISEELDTVVFLVITAL
jgi:hypothetical protein